MTPSQNVARPPEAKLASPSLCSLLVVDDERDILTTLSALLSAEFEVMTVDSAETAQQMMAQRDIDLILADQQLPGMTGVQLLEWVRQHSPRTIRMLMTGFATFEDAIKAINCGQVYRYLFKPWRADELLAMVRDAARLFQLEQNQKQLLDQLRCLNQELAEQVQQRTRELEAVNHQLQQKNGMLEKLALTDPLTGMPNRRAIDGLVESELRRRSRYRGSLALGLIDVDHFKKVNARYLLPGGDQVLIGLAKTFSNSLRTVDSIGRIGGEEFLVVAPETGLDGARVLGERIRTAVENSQFLYRGDVISVTVSVGFAVAEPDVLADYERFKHVAAAALEHAKNGGRNLCVVQAITPPASKE